MRARAIAPALLLAGCASKPAELPPLTPPVSERDRQADSAIELFIASCVKFLMKPGDLTRWIEQNGLQHPNAEIAAEILQDEKGEVWFAQNPIGTFYLVVVPVDATATQCAVLAQRADAKRLTEQFERLLRSFAGPGFEVGPVLDHTFDTVLGAYRQLVYFLAKEGSERGLIFMATTSASEWVAFQGRLDVLRGKKE